MRSMQYYNKHNCFCYFARIAWLGSNMGFLRGARRRAERRGPNCEIIDRLQSRRPKKVMLYTDTNFSRGACCTREERRARKDDIHSPAQGKKRRE